MKAKILLVTGNEGKIRETQAILGSDYEILHQKLELEEIQDIDSSEVITHKVKQAFNLSKTPVVVDDTSLSLDAFNGLPGALVKWFLDTVGCEGICQMLSKFSNRKAIAQCTVGYYDGKNLKIFIGEETSAIVTKPRGDKGIGWDPIFQPNRSSKTYAEMEFEEKNKASMRRKALKKLKQYLDEKD